MRRQGARLGGGFVARVTGTSNSSRQQLIARALATSNSPKPPKEGMDWASLQFGLTKTDYMYVATAKRGSTFAKGEIKPYGPLSIEPAATVLSYGQAIFEGLKAFRTVKNRIIVFRPSENSARVNVGAARFMMSPVPEEVFLHAIDQSVIANSHMVPPVGQGALYLRPILFGSGPALGVAPSPEYTFVVYSSPVGSYFKGGLKTINLLATMDTHRAATKGAGFVKAAGNYAPCFESQQRAKKEGFDEVLFLDAKEDKHVEEAGAANFFCVTTDGTLHTPALRGTILAGVTRSSIIQLAQEKGMKVNEGLIPLEVVLKAREAFCTGTGASITPVGTITARGKKYTLGDGNVGAVTKDFYETLLGIQMEKIPDTHGWLRDPWAVQ